MIDGFSESTFTHDGVSRAVYRRGSGPGVLIMHEIPGITPDVAAFARRVADDGFSVAMPNLFGIPGKPLSTPYAARQMLRACINREFSILAAHASSPITNWLRALGRALHAEIGGRGIGALGMCITGNFALTLMLDAHLLAPVLSQPSLPFCVGRGRRAALHITPQNLDVIKERVQTGAGVLGLRFTNDPLCPPERFATLRRELGDGFEGIEIDSSRGNPSGLSRIAHSVLTKDLVDSEGHPTRQALERVLAFFHERLDEPPLR